MRTPLITTGLLLGMLASFAGTVARGLELKCGADHNCNMLPDMSEPTNSRHLKCGACQLAAVQLAHAVIKKEAALKQKMTEFDATTLLEVMCCTQSLELTESAVLGECALARRAQQ